MYNAFFQKSRQEALGKALIDLEKKYITENFQEFDLSRFTQGQSTYNEEKNIVAAIFRGIDIFNPDNSGKNLPEIVKDEIFQYENILVLLKLAGLEYKDIAKNLEHSGQQFRKTAEQIYQSFKPASAPELPEESKPSEEPQNKETQKAKRKPRNTKKEKVNKKRNTETKTKTFTQKKETPNYSFEDVQAIFLQFLYDFLDKNIKNAGSEIPQNIQAEIDEYQRPQNQVRHDLKSLDCDGNIIEKIFFSTVDEASDPCPLFENNRSKITKFRGNDLLKEIRNEITSPNGIFPLLCHAKIDLKLISAIFCKSGQNFSKIAITLRDDLAKIELENGEITCLDAISVIEKNAALYGSQRSSVIRLTQNKRKDLAASQESDNFLSPDKFNSNHQQDGCASAAKFSSTEQDFLTQQNFPEAFNANEFDFTALDTIFNNRSSASPSNSTSHQSFESLQQQQQLTPRK